MKHTFLYSALLSILIVSCHSNDKNPSYPSVGTLHYKITYPKDAMKSPAITLFPQELSLSFDNDKIRNEINGGFNMFSLSFYSASPNDSCYVTFNFMNKILSYAMNKSNCVFLYEPQGSVDITYLKNEHKVIAGFNCKKAQVQFNNQKPFPVYYTQEINIKKANRHTPFKDIDGVLMQFPIEYKGMNLTMTANSFTSKKPKASTFELPQKSTRTTKNEIDSMITTLLKNFK